MDVLPLSLPLAGRRAGVGAVAVSQDRYQWFEAANERYKTSSRWRRV